MEALVLDDVVWYDEEKCYLCKYWERNGIHTGTCMSERSDMYERVTYNRHVCKSPFKCKL